MVRSPQGDTMGILFLALSLLSTALIADDVLVLVDRSDFSFPVADNQALVITVAYSSWTHKLTIEFFAYDPPGMMAWLLGYSKKLLARRTFEYVEGTGVVAQGDSVPKLMPIEKMLNNSVLTPEQWADFCRNWIAELTTIINSRVDLQKIAPLLSLELSRETVVRSAERAYVGLFLDRYLTDLAGALHSLATAF